MRNLIIIFLIIVTSLMGNQINYGVNLIDSIGESKERESHIKETIEYIKKIKKTELLIGVVSGTSLFDYNLKEEKLDLFRLISYSIEKLYDLDVKFIFADDYIELEGLLKAKKIDLILGMSDKFGRNLSYKFSIPIINRNIGVFSKGNLKDIKKIYVDDEIFWNYKMDEIFEKLGNKVSYEILPKEYFDYSLLSDYRIGLVDGEDGLNDINKSNGKGVHFNNLLNKPVYIVFERNEDSRLIDGFNINLSGKLGEIIRKYYKHILQEERKNYFFNELTKEEKKYLEDNKVLNIYVEKHHFPYIFYDEENEEYKGVFMDLMNDFSQLTKQKLFFLELNQGITNENIINLSDGLFLMTEGSFDKEKKIIESNYNLIDEMILVGNLESIVYSNNPKDYIGNYIGVVEEKAETTIVNKYYSSMNQIKKYNNFDKMFEALEENEINYAIVHRGIYQYYKVFNQNHRMKEVLRFYTIKVPLAGLESQKLIIDIFNKAIETKALNVDLYLNKWRSYTVNLEEVIIDKNKIIQKEYARQKKILFYMYLLSFLLIVFTIIIIKFYKKSKRSNCLLHRQLYFEPDMNIPNKRTFMKNKTDIDLKILDAVVCIAIANQLEINQLYTFKEGEEIRIKIGKILKKMEIDGIIGELYYVNAIYILIIRNCIKEDVPQNILFLEKTLKNSSNKKVQLRISYSIKEENEAEFQKIFEKAYFLVNSSEISAIVEATTKIIDDEKELLFLATDLPRAIKDREIIPYFQPKISCETGKVNGVEALARWIHPEKGIIPPYKFISRAEENDNIIGVDLLIAESAMFRLKQWQLKRIVSKDFVLSFNLSPRTLMLENIAEKIEKLLNKYRIDPKNIEVEVTERVVINNYEHFENIISKLRNMGVLVAIDDFSAGNASLDYIIKIDFTTLKIDKSLLTGVTIDNQKKLEVYKAVVDIGKKLNMKLVAEGVETEIEDGLIKSFGVDEIQGYFYSKPKKEKDFLEFLKKI